jgi:hypothetical protein
MATMLEEIHRGALHDLAAWAGVDVSAEESAAALLARIATAGDAPFEQLSTRGLRLLAEAREIPIESETSRVELIRRLRRARSWRDSWRAHRRRMAGSLISRALSTTPGPGPAGPIHSGGAERLKQRVQRHGVVAGIAGELRGAADSYVAQKLDEIERRVDAKLDQIDDRLRQWRDREVATRLRLLKLTLIVAILVALISLGYDYVRQSAAFNRAAPPAEVDGARD